DLGNLKKGKTEKDTFFAFREIFSSLNRKNIPLIILGGSKNISYAVYQSYSESNNSVNITTVNSKIESFNQQGKKDRTNFLEKIITEKDNYLFSYTNIGYQNYYVNDDDIAILNKLLFNTFRLGIVRENIREVEPEIRDTDFLSFDISSIRQADAPAHQDPCPNGFFGEEACQIAKYAGISDRLNCFGLFELNPEYDSNAQTVNLASQIIWYFIEGLKLRKHDLPNDDKSDFKEFIVELSESAHKIIFYKSPRSDRWWMEVPSGKSHHQKSIMVACSYEDYQKACNQEIPDRWLKAFQKIR
ncbi:arginase family protein, partial [Bacteroidota bacterium]